MKSIDHYAEPAEDDISAAGTGRREPAEALGSAQAWALLAVAAALDRLADAVSELGTPPVYQPPRRR